MSYKLIRPLLFKLDPEATHNLALKTLKYLYPVSRVKRLLKVLPQKPVKVFDLNFNNPIGLAAGYDKNGDCIDELFGLGFGFIEVGTVTPKPQDGNPKPRLFRIPAAQALINRMGFNGFGLDYLVTRLKQRKIPGIVGVNIGKNLATPIDRAVEDYVTGLVGVYPYADYIVINISSPNTPGLRDLQNRERLSLLLRDLSEKRQQLIASTARKVPLLVKITVDLAQEDLYALLDTVLNLGMDGIICSNTTIDHHQVAHLKDGQQVGGVSGKPLFEKVHTAVRHISNHLQGRMPIIAVGGIDSPDDALKLFDAGASLLQVYTGLIYQGPSLVREIIKVL